MSNIPHFAKYAAAFERAYASDDWSLVAPFFTEDAVYEVVGIAPPLGGRFEGRDAILAYFPRVLDTFDRRFATREVGIVAGPREEGDAVWVRGSARYTAPGLPELAFELEETAWFEGARIRKLEDRYDEAHLSRIADWSARHGARLGLRLD